MLNKSKKSKKGTVVSEAEHKKWHAENECCGCSKEHDACMKKWGIIIKKRSGKVKR
jgi:hypothetical protein